MTSRMVDAGGVQLCLETFGDPGDPAVLLLGGATASMDCWEPEFCRRLAGAGRCVVRYDQRDTGRSAVSPPGRPTYSSLDLATDPLRVLDALAMPRAHLVGVSMGGGIAQLLAARHAGRVRTITLIATSPGGERTATSALPPPTPRLRETFDNPPPAPAWDDREAVIDHLVEGERPYAGSLGFDEDRVRRRAAAVVDRSTDVAAAANHWLAAGEGQPFRLADIGVPTLVLHGTDDPLFPFEHGQALAEEIPGARLVALAGMGHEVPPPTVWDVVVREIAAHTASS